VSITFQHHLSLAVATAANGNAPGQRRVLEGVGEQADHTWRSRVGSPLAAKLGLDLGAQLDVGGLSHRLDRVADRAASPTSSTSPATQRLDPGQGQQRLGQAVHPLGILGESAEEVVERLRVVLGALLRTSIALRCRRGDCAAHGRRWRLKSGFGPARGASRRCGRERRRDRALLGQRASAHRVGAVAIRSAGWAGESELGGASQVLGWIRSLGGWPSGVEQLAPARL
jgi:hypothetical protein